MKKIIVSFLILGACAASLFAVRGAGSAARVQGASFDLARDRFPVHLVEKTSDVAALWKEQGVRGRVVLHLGKFLHFMKSGAPTGGPRRAMLITEGTSIADILAGDPTHFNQDRPDYKNFLWIAYQTDVAREIYNVVPAADFMQRFGVSAASAGSKDVDAQVFGFPRTVTTRLPALAEPVLLNIDASYFGSADPAGLLDALLKSGLRADLVTVCLAQDNPDVTDLDRQKLLGFTRLLAGHARLIPPTAAPTVAK